MHSQRQRRVWTSLLALGVLVCSPAADVFAAKPKDWITMENCQFVPDKDNDGDSFHIKCQGTEYVARLYFVDAPETGGLGASRLSEQATYFGIEVPQAIEVGLKAKHFVEEKLAQPFMFLTRKASGLGHGKIERFYGFIETKDGDLGQLLVVNGLARVHGKSAVRPGTSNASEEIEKLQQLEQKAKEAKLGAWGINTAPSSTPQPARTVNLPSATPPPSPLPARSITPAGSPANASASDKLDINSATREELRKIPGIGESLADRIIAARPFSSADDLKKVKGVGAGKRYEQVRPYFR